MPVIKKMRKKGSGSMSDAESMMMPQGILSGMFGQTSDFESQILQETAKEPAKGATTIGEMRVPRKKPRARR